MYKDFGSLGNNIFYNHGLLALYNRYAGIMRVFYYIEEPELEDDELVISVQFQPSDAYKNKTALFSHAAPIMKAVQEFDPDYEMSMSTSTLASPFGLWVYADFPMAYDPCTCGSQAKLAFMVKTINNQTISLEGTISGTAEQIVPKSSSTTDQLAGLTNFSKALNSTIAAVNNGYKATAS